MSGDGRGVSHGRFCEAAQQSVAQDRKQERDRDRHQDGRRRTDPAAFGHCGSAFHSDRQHQIDDDAFGHRFGHGQIGAQSRRRLRK